MFISFVFAFIIAVFGFYQLANLPSITDNLLVGSAFVISLVGLAWGCKQGFFCSKTSAFDLQTSLRVFVKHRLVSLYLGFIIGVCWVFGQTFFAVSVQEVWLNKPVQLQGTVSGLILQEQTKNRVRLRFEVELDKIQSISQSNRLAKSPKNSPDETPEKTLASAVIKHAASMAGSQMPIAPINEQAWSLIKPTLRLSWYLSQKEFQTLESLPQTGQRWQFIAKLKANHSAMNIGALDYETWLFQNRIEATGYILQKPKKSWLAQPLQARDTFDLRFWLSQRLSAVFDGFALNGLYQALTYGNKNAITNEQWQVLQSTGTIHLMAISGLHMAIIAGLGYWAFKGLWWLGLYRYQRFNFPMVGALGAWLFASVYLILSGFAIPTQRAYLMVLAVLLFIVIKRQFQPWTALALAAFLVVFWDTRAVLSIGFWLSFLAVGFIFAMLSQPFVKRAPWWQQLLWIQFILTVGLAPYLIWAFHSVPIYSFISNLFAVPFVSFIGLPALFFVSLISLFSIEFAQWTMQWVEQIWLALWWGLQWVSALDFTLLTFGHFSAWQVWASYAGLFAVLLLSTWKQKVAALVFLSMVFSLSYVGQDRPKSQQAWLHVLDVGQGQAVIIETAHHVLVYDTGAKWGDKMDGAKMAILPFLRSRGLSEVAHVMVSHSDLDHAGGLASLLAGISVKQVSSGQPGILETQLSEKKASQSGSNGASLGSSRSDFNSKNASNALLKNGIQRCQAGQSWVWDGVKFEVLSPGLVGFDAQFKSDNDRSCVLKVQAGNQSVLIPGDLSSKAETHLIKAYGAQLQSTILIAGHHGSRSSTSLEWLARVQPEVVIFSAGYKNRYGFPSVRTLERLDSTVSWFNTACSGGIGYRLGLSDLDTQPKYQVRKTQQKWYHHRCLNHQKGTAFQ